jgi:hypothetical protein
VMNWRGYERKRSGLIGVISQYLPGENEGIHETCRYSQCHSRDSKQIPSEYEPRINSKESCSVGWLVRSWKKVAVA